MNTLTLVPATKDSLKAEAQSWSAKANALQITDAASCVNVSFLLRSIKGVMLEIDAVFAPELDALTEARRDAEAKRKAKQAEVDAIKAPLVQAEPLIKRKLLDFEQAQERARLADQERLQLLAREQAERASIDAAAALELEATATGNVEMLAEAEDIFSQPVEAPVVVIKTSMPRVQGISYRDNWVPDTKEYDTVMLCPCLG